MGESAGGGSVLHQITAYGGLKGSVPFQQAILQSPGQQWNPSNNCQEETFQYVLGNASLFSNTSVKSVEDLRQLPTSTLVKVNDAIIARSVYGLYSFGPTVDGEFVPALPPTLIDAGQYASNLSLIVSHNYNEGVLFTDPFIANTSNFAANVRTYFPSALSSVVDYITTTLYPAIFNGSYGTQPRRYVPQLLVRNHALLATLSTWPLARPISHTRTLSTLSRRSMPRTSHTAFSQGRLLHGMGSQSQLR